MHPTGHHAAGLRDLAAAVIAGAGLLTATAATAAAAGPDSHPVPRGTTGDITANATPAQTIHLVAHEKQRKFLNNGGFGDEEIFRGILDNAAGTTRVGIFAGTLTSVNSTDSVNLATVDLQLPGGQIAQPRGAMMAGVVHGGSLSAAVTMVAVLPAQRGLLGARLDRAWIGRLERQRNGAEG